jgi:Type IV secretion-system coupling protein DNA-binding domain
MNQLNWPWARPLVLASYVLGWPRKVDEDAVVSVFAALAAEAAPGPLVLEVTGQAGELTHLLHLPPPRAPATLRRLQVGLPGLRPTLTDQPKRQDMVYNQAWGLQLSSHRRPLRTDHAEALSLGILDALSGTRRNEILTLQWLLGPRLRAMAIPTRFQDFRSESWWQALLSAPFSAPSPIDPELRRALATKQNLAGWRALGRLAVRASSSERERQLLHELLAALRVAESPGLKLQATVTNPRAVSERRLPLRWPSVINEREIVGLSGWPVGDVNVAGLQRSPAAALPPSRTVPRHGRVIGDSTFPGDERPLAVSVRDSLQHSWVIGPTGSGKSVLLANLLLQDAAAGRAAVLIDTKGDLVDDVLGRLPANRLDDVVVLDPADETRPVGLNPLAGNHRNAALRADQLLGVFHALYGENLGPRSQDILHACFLTLAGRDSGMSLCAVPLLLSNVGFRRRLTAGLDDPLGVGSFWHWYESVSEAERQAAVAPVMNKLRAFLLRPSLRRVLGQTPPRFELRQVFTERKILLVSLAKGLLGPETAQLFGALVFNQLWQATQGRTAVPAERRHPVMVYLDEFQDYLRLPTDLADVLAQSRGLGVGLTLAHQHLGQLTPDVRSAVLANAGSRICFRLNHDDATVLARGSRIPSPEDFAGLGHYQAYVSLLAGGERTPYASAGTRPPQDALRPAADVRRHSAASFGQDGGLVEASLRALVSGAAEPVSPGTIGRKPRGSQP